MEIYDAVKYENGETLLFKGTFFGIPVYVKEMNVENEENIEMVMRKSTDQTEIW